MNANSLPSALQTLRGTHDCKALCQAGGKQRRTQRPCPLGAYSPVTEEIRYVVSVQRVTAWDRVWGTVRGGAESATGEPRVCHGYLGVDWLWPPQAVPLTRLKHILLCLWTTCCSLSFGCWKEKEQRRPFCCYEKEGSLPKWSSDTADLGGGHSWLPPCSPWSQRLSGASRVRVRWNLALGICDLNLICFHRWCRKLSWMIWYKVHTAAQGLRIIGRIPAVTHQESGGTSCPVGPEGSEGNTSPLET